MWVRPETMRTEYTVTDATGQEQRLTEVQHPDWESLTEPCPECGGCEFRHFSSEGGHYASQNGTVIMRTEYWDADRTLLTQCRSCDEILYKHPAFDLLYETDATDDGSSL